MIPTAMLRQRGTIEPFLGSGAQGPAFGPPVERVPMRFVGKRRAVRTRDGVDVIASGSIAVRPDVTIAAQSRVTIDGGTYTVLDVAESQDLAQRHHRELIVEGPR